VSAAVVMGFALLLPAVIELNPRETPTIAPTNPSCTTTHNFD
jgi:hypothetical protein